MSSDPATGVADLGRALAQWSGTDPTRRAVAGVVEAMAGTAIAVAALVAASPLDADEAGASAAGTAGTNASGDLQKPLDVRAEALFLTALESCDVAAVCSEETEAAIAMHPSGSVVVALDPIDGSSNIDINAPTGTIFAVLPTAGHRRRRRRQHSCSPGVRNWQPA